MKTAILALLALGTMHGANIIQNPGFETNAIFPDTFSILGTGDSTHLPGWVVTGSGCTTNCVLLLTNSYAEGSLQFFSHGGTQNLDLTGGGNTVDGGIQQTVSLTGGVNYSLSFWLGNMDNAANGYALASVLEVFLNGVTQGTFSNGNSTTNQTNWQQFTLNFTPGVSGNTTIRFVNATGSSDNYIGLDDVFLDATPRNGVPEPATAGMLGAGLVVIAAVCRKSVRR